MSFLDSLSSMVGQNSQNTGAQGDQPSTEQHTSITQALMQHFSSQPGGLSGVLNQFRQNGMGEHVESWLGAGANKPLQPDQVEQGLGQDHVNAIAQQSNSSPSMVKMALSTALPMLISHFAGGSGHLPEQANSGSGLTGMAESLFSRVL